MGKIRMDLQNGIKEQEQIFDTSRANSKKEEFLSLLQQGMSRKEAYDAVGRDKSWASKIIKEIRETSPERLKGTMEEIKPESKDMPQNAHKPRTALKNPQAGKSTEKEKNVENGANTAQKQVFSFRAAVEDIADWKAYAAAAGLTVESFCSAAMHEYLSRHPLAGEERTIFKLLRSRNSKK